MFLNSDPCWKTQPIVVFEPENTKLFGIRILPHLEKSKFNLSLVDDAPSLDIVPRKHSVPVVRFDLTSF